MSDPTAERVAKNDATFRDANEAIASSAEAYEIATRVPFICECAEPTCREIVQLPLDEYRRVRSNSRWFLNAIGHEVAAQGHASVVEKNDTWQISEKIGAAGEITEELDSRARD